MHSHVSILACMLLLKYRKTDPCAIKVQIQGEKKVRIFFVAELASVVEKEPSVTLLEQ